MAVVLNQNQQQEDENQQQQPGQPIALTSGGPSAPAVAPMARAGGGSRPTSRQRQGSGRFTNLQRYIDANQGAAARTGRQIERVAEKTQQRAQPETQRRLSDIRSQIQSEQQRLGQAGQFAQTVQQGSTEDVSNLAQNRLDDFTRLRTGQNLARDIQSAGTQATGLMGQTAGKLQNIADQSRTEAGRFNLLRNAIGGPRYSAGQRRLDQLILQGGGAGELRNLQQNLGQRATQKQQAVNQFGQELQSGVSNIQEQSQAAQQQLQSALGRFGEQAGFGEAGTGALGQLATTLEQQRAQAEQEQASELERIRNIVSQNAFGKMGGEEALRALGLDTGQRLFNVDLSKYAGQLTAGDADITKADIIQDEQQRRLDALTQLAGIQDGINLGQRQGERGVVFQGQQGLQDELAAGQAELDKLLAEEFERARLIDATSGGQNRNRVASITQATGQQLLDIIEGRASRDDLAQFYGLGPNVYSKQAYDPTTGRLDLGTGGRTEQVFNLTDNIIGAGSNFNPETMDPIEYLRNSNINDMLARVRKRLEDIGYFNVAGQNQQTAPGTVGTQLANMPAVKG